jgi:hypothetical protein
MRVIEQLVQHFWARGALTRDEALYLVKHGFVREADLAGLVDSPPVDDEIEVPDSFNPRGDPRFDPKAREAEQLEDELVGRNSAGGRKGGKKKPAGHNVAPVALHLGSHLAAREPYPALQELGSRLKKCATWRDAAKAVAASKPDKLEAALVALLGTRARALGELWFWFDVEPLYAWTEHADNTGPVADAIRKLVRADTPGGVGRLEQLKKAPEVQALTDLLAARKPFLAMLPVLYSRYFDKLGLWLIPPTAPAAAVWPALPWSFVLAYNAHMGTPDVPPAGYPVDPHQLTFELLKAALAAALPLDPTAVRELLIHRIRERAEPLPDRADWGTNAVFDRPLHCPYSWKV